MTMIQDLHLQSEAIRATMRVFLDLLLISGAAAFAGVQRHPRAPQTIQSNLRSKLLSGATLQRESLLPATVNDEPATAFSPVKRPSFPLTLPTLATSALAWTATAQAALADSPDWGLFEGRTCSLLHPIMMGSLLLYSIYTGLLGFQWRRQRTIGDEIKALQKSLPDLQGGSTVQEALAAARSAEEPQTSRIAVLQAALPVEQQIKELQKERKSLVEAGPRDKHYSQGALLAFLGTAFAIEVRCIERGLSPATARFCLSSCF
jgi:hypothetical protein